MSALCTMAAFLFTFTFTACDDDDDDDGGSSSGSSSSSSTSSKVGGFTGTDGVKYFLSSVTDESGSYAFEFSYDSNGNITEIVESDEGKCSITYDPMTILYYRYDGEEEITFSNITTNDNGYITGFTASGTVYGEILEETATFTYDGNRLTNVTYDIVYSDDDYTDSYTGDVTFTWDSKGALTKIMEVEDVSDSEGDVDVYTYSLQCDYGSYGYENATKQYTRWTWEIEDIEEDNVVECLAWLGYFGEGPAYLPEKVTQTEDEYSTEYETEYVSRSSGTVAAEYYYNDSNNNGYMSYSYITEDELPE